MTRPITFTAACVLLLAAAHPVSAVVLTFQEEDGGAFSATNATFINNCCGHEGLAFGEVNQLEIGFSVELGSQSRTLLQFPDFLGPDPGQVPLGSHIDSATVEIISRSSTTSSYTVHQLLTTWAESTTTWNNLGTGPGGVGGTDYVNTATTTFLPPSVGSSFSFDITDLVQAWSSGDDNLGLIMLPANTSTSNSFGFCGTDTAPNFNQCDDISLQPMLTVSFTSIPEPEAFVPLAYVSNLSSEDVSVIDAGTNALVATIPVGVAPGLVAVSPDGSRAYVANGGSGASDSTLSVIDTTTNAVIETIPLGAVSSYAVAVSPTGDRLYVTNAGSDNVSVVDAATSTVIGTVPVADEPFGVAVTPDGTRAFVTNFRSLSVSVIDTGTLTVLTTIGAGNGPNGVVVRPDGFFVYVANSFSDSVTVIDPATNTVVTTIPVGDLPSGLAVSPDGSRVYTANGGSSPPFVGSVSVIDTTTHTLVTSVPAGSFTIQIAVSPDGSHVYATNQNSDDVTVIDTTTNTVVDTIPVGDAPRGIGFALVPAMAAVVPSLATPLRVLLVIGILATCALLLRARRPPDGG